MFKKHFINILYISIFTKNTFLNVYKVKASVFGWKCFLLNIYRITEEMKVMLEMFSNIHHEMFDKQYTQNNICS